MAGLEYEGTMLTEVAIKNGLWVRLNSREWHKGRKEEHG